MQADGMAELVEEGALQLRVAVLWHLESNHFPPVHRAFLQPALEAIEHARLDDWDHLIELPNGNVVSTTEVVDGLRLDSFCAEFELTDEDGGPFDEEHDEDGNVL
jgi:hypothetical protein